MCCEMVNLENMPSEISQSLKDKYYVIPLVWDSLSSSVYALLLYTSIIYVDKINSVSSKSIKEEKNKTVWCDSDWGWEYHIIKMVVREVTFELNAQKQLAMRICGSEFSRQRENRWKKTLRHHWAWCVQGTEGPCGWNIISKDDRRGLGGKWSGPGW